VGTTILLHCEDPRPGAIREQFSSPAYQYGKKLMSNTQYRADVDGLRAVSIALVVAFHAAPRIIPGGFVGVDVFLSYPVT
jgi:hypothetical protein